MSSSLAQLERWARCINLTLAVVVLTLMVLAHLTLRWWVRRKARQEKAAIAGPTSGDMRLRRWVIRGLTETLPSLVLLIWIQGLYFTSNLVVRETGLRSGNRDSSP